MKRRAVLLSLLAGWLIGPALATPPLDQFEASVRDYEARDRAHPVVPGGTVFIGSSTFALWGEALEREFAEFQAINRGFGGSTIPEVNHYRNRLVYAYRPRTIVFYAGTNDLAGGRSPEQVRADFGEFARATATALPEARIGFVSLSLPPCRVHLRAAYAQANRWIQEDCPGYANVDFIDLSGVVLDEQGNPREDLFRADRLHMNAAGYALWIPRLRAYLQSRA